MEIPGVGPLLASAFVATIADPQRIQVGAMPLGLDRTRTEAELERGQGKARQHLQGGNRYLRQLLVVGAMAVIRYAERNGTRRPWLVQLMART